MRLREARPRRPASIGRLRGDLRIGRRGSAHPRRSTDPSRTTPAVPPGPPPRPKMPLVSLTGLMYTNPPSPNVGSGIPGRRVTAGVGRVGRVGRIGRGSGAVLGGDGLVHAERPSGDSPVSQASPSHASGPAAGLASGAAPGATPPHGRAGSCAAPPDTPTPPPPDRDAPRPDDAPDAPSRRCVRADLLHQATSGRSARRAAGFVASSALHGRREDHARPPARATPRPKMPENAARFAYRPGRQVEDARVERVHVEQRPDQRKTPVCDETIMRLDDAGEPDRIMAGGRRCL